jgi:ornithine decarboxylase
MKNYQTPYFLYNPTALDRNINDFKVFSDNRIKIYYAVKSNTYAPLIKTLVGNNYGFDVASIEEILLVQRLGGEPKYFSFSAPTKLENEIKEAANLGVEQYAFDSKDELLKIINNVHMPKLIARMAVSNCDLNAQDLSGIFGMSSAYYKEILTFLQENQLPLYGLTFHVGSQNTQISSWDKALNDMENILNVSQKYGQNIKLLNIGGGIPVPYDDEIKPMSFYIENICNLIVEFKKKHPAMEVVVEPGRAISANTKTLYTSIINQKNYKVPPILVTDITLFNGLIEIFENTEYKIEENYKDNNSKRKVFRICGFSCDGYDIIKQKCLLPENITVGDILKINTVGAYTFVYSNFHLKSHPPIYMVT